MRNLLGIHPSSIARNHTLIRITTVTHLATACIPQVNAIAQPDSKDIMLRPIDEVEVEVVLQGGRI